MPIRMKESDRVRDAKRAVLLIENCTQYGYIVCEYCGEITMTPQIDHFIPRSQGGAAKDLNNCVVSCPSCNGRRCDRSVAAVFGQEVEDRVINRLATRHLAQPMWEAARTIYRISRVTDKQLEMIYNWVYTNTEAA